MAFIPGPSVAQVILEFAQGDGELAQNVFYVQTAGTDAISTDELDGIATTFHTWWGTGSGGAGNYRAKVQSSTQLLAIGVRDMTTVDAGRVVLDVNESGTDGGEKNPNGLTFTLTARTATAGRSFRGRTYLVGLTANFLAGAGSEPNLADVTHASDIVAGFNALIPAVAATTGHHLVVASRVASGVPRAALLTTNVVSYGYHDLFMDYQRRRAPGHNRHH